MAGASRPTKAVLQKVPTNAPFKKPADVPQQDLPKGGAKIAVGLPGVPGDPSLNARPQGQPSSAPSRRMVDANTLHTTTSYAQGEGTAQNDAESPLYGSGPGLGPQTDIRPPTVGAPPRVPKTGGTAKVAGIASDPGKYAR